MALPACRWQNLPLTILLLPLPLPLLLQLEEDFVRANPEWVKELEIMVATKVCVDAEERLRG